MSISPAANNRTQKQLLRRRGATLMELSISLTVAATLLAGMASAMLIATRTFDNGTSPESKTCETGDVADQITADLNFAISFSEQTPNAVTFTVPDRNADSNAETIRYAWSGVQGALLTRQYNGGPVVAIGSDMRQFSLSYLTRTVGPAPPAPEVEGSEQVLIYHDNAPGGGFQQFDLDSVSWCAQYFKPTLPANTTHWKITRVKVRGKQAGTPYQNLAIEIRTADSTQKPTTTVIDSVIVSESALTNGWGWNEFYFSKLSGLDSASGYCLVIKQITSSGYSGLVHYEENGTPMPANTHWLTTSNGGSSWTTPNSTQDMRFYVYGTVTTQ